MNIVLATLGWRSRRRHRRPRNRRPRRRPAPHRRRHRPAPHRQPPHRSPRATSRWSTTPTRSSSPFLRHGVTSILLPKPTPKGLRFRTSPLRPNLESFSNSFDTPGVRLRRLPVHRRPVDTPRRVRAPGRMRDVRGQDLRRPGVRRCRADRHELRAQRDDVEHGGGKSGRRVVHGRPPSEDRQRRRVAHDSAHVQLSRGTGQGSERHHDDNHHAVDHSGDRRRRRQRGLDDAG